MPKSNPGIVFMGTPEFAVASLEAILRAGYPVKGVVTSPDKPSGRGLQMHPSPVKRFALKHKLPVLQPLKLKDDTFLGTLHNLKANLQVVVAFRMLPEEVWSMPPLGTFNLHASLLPQYRGAAPINWAVINGETRTGVTTFFINHEIDKGSIIYREETPIGADESAGDVHDRLMILGAQLVVKTISDIANGTVVPVEQHKLGIAEPLNPAPKIFRNDCRINWNHGVRKLHDFIRGLSPYPAAWAEMIADSGEPIIFKIFAAKPVIKDHQLSTGSIISDNKNYMSIAVSDGFINIQIIQMQGKRQMPVHEFLRGFTINESHKFI